MSEVNLLAADQIGRNLLTDALWQEGRCNWIARVIRPAGTEAYGTLECGIYDGLAGVAFFLGHLWLATGERAYKKGAAGAIRQALASARDQSRHAKLSFFTGALGVAAVAVQLSTIMQDEAIRGAAVDLAFGIARDIRNRELDLISGSAGTSVGLLILGRCLRSEYLLQAARRSSDRLLRRLQFIKSHLTGLSHGASGIAFSLLETFVATNEMRFRREADAVFNYERQWFNSDARNWPDFRDVHRKLRKTPFTFATDWCHGAPGIALARIRAFEITHDATYEREAQVALQTTKAAVESDLRSDRRASLCHGLAGNAAILLEARRYGVDGPKTAKLLHAAARESAKRAPALESVGLFLGRSGIGYLNLQMCDSSLPSILLPRFDAWEPGQRLARSPEIARRPAVL